MIKKLCIIISILALATAGIAGLGIYWLVAVNPGESISQEYLDKILSVESPVYYKDGVSKIGVFFEDAHRQYLPYQRLPTQFINSIVAAEDHNFFSHFGVDFLGIARAMYANVRAGRVVQGGSTITQQTAKNLYKRKDRSIKEKIKELLYAWRLEYHYSKEKILEFYVNQFYVSGNGRGLGVAARYYFDRPASDLTLLQCAFIAGSVKRPNYYNPFIKKDEQSIQLARQRAKTRARYVLDKMLKLKMITGEQYKENIDREVSFKKGQMSYALNTIMDMVKEALVELEVEEALVSYGIDNIATSGIKIFTTIDENLQKQSLYALRKELSRLSIRLEGYDHAALQRSYRELAKNKNKITPYGFTFGRIISVENDVGSALKVSFSKKQNGTGELVEGVIDQKSIEAALNSYIKYERQLWAEKESGDLDAFMTGFAKGDLIYVSVRGYDTVAGHYLLDLERYPEIQGGFVALKDGVIRAMVGGHENRFFNRATARRLMGSTAKPLLYTAAIQLGWSSLDLLNNSRDAFVYHGQTYFPRPDHHSPFAGVSMNWAGTKSENVASVWLLYNLCERLSGRQFKKLTTSLGLARKKNESYQSYKVRIRDNEGILVNKVKLMRVALKNAVEEIGPDLLFSGKFDEGELLKRFHYKLDESVVSKTDSSKESVVRRQILLMSYVKMNKLGVELNYLQDTLVKDLSVESDLPSALSAWGSSANFYVNNYTKKYAYGTDLSDGIWQNVDVHHIADLVRDGIENKKPWSWDAVLLDGMVSVSAFKLLKEALNKEHRRLSKQPAYGEDILYQIKDFRVLVGLRYLISLCHEMGINSPLESVLSFPLGSNVITLLDLARSYGTIISGSNIRSGRVDASDSLLVIDRIESRSGDEIYRPKQTKKEIVDKQTSLAVADILRNVVKFGTGRSAQKNIRLRSQDSGKERNLVEVGLSVPALGKTGTSNSFRNSTFSGFLPGPKTGKNAVSLENGYLLAAYVGYDDNRPMVRKSTRISGSSGALPVWNRVANAIVLQSNFSEEIDIEDLAFAGHLEIPLIYPELGQIEIPSDDMTKIDVDDPKRMSYSKESSAQKYGNGMTTFGDVDLDGKIYPLRYYKPYWTVGN